jgi:hypothetical protein
VRWRSKIYLGVTAPKPGALPHTGLRFDPIRALGLALAALILLRLVGTVIRFRRRRRAA